MEGSVFPFVTFILTTILSFPQVAPVRGVVKSPDGSLCKEAEVFLVSPGIPTLRKTKVLRTKTDGRGRFRFEVDSGTDSYVWAHGTSFNGESFCTDQGFWPGGRPKTCVWSGT